MLLDDRLVGAFGIVSAGDRTDIVKVAVAAARAGFAVVPMLDDAVTPACALGVRDAKKEHYCYHPMTVDTKVRAAFNRLTKDGATCNIAIDLELSMIGWCRDVSWWEGPEISPTLIGLDGEQVYVFDLADTPLNEVPDNMVTEGMLLVPPTTIAEAGDYIQLVGQLNHLSDNVRKEEPVDPNSNTDGIDDTLWSDNAQNEVEQNERIEGLEFKVEFLAEQLGEAVGTIAQLKQALIVALESMARIKERLDNGG